MNELIKITTSERVEKENIKELKEVMLIKGDCLKELKKIQNGGIDLILTDMPYIISKEGGFSQGGSWNNPKDGRYRKTPPKTEFGEWDKEPLDLDSLLKEFYRILKPSGTLIMFYDMYKIQELKECAERFKFKQPRLCIWQKTNPVPVNSKLNYLSNSREYFISFVKGGKPTFNSQYDNGFYSYPICSGKERTSHPTQKPLSLMNELVLKHSNEGEVILDCFMGAGSTGVSAICNKRKFIGIEKEEKYFEIAYNRIKEETFKKTSTNIDEI